MSNYEREAERFADFESDTDEAITVDLRGMTAAYDLETRTYTVTSIRADDAHVLIWGGRQEDIARAQVALRHALVAAEDEIPEEHYKEATANL